MTPFEKETVSITLSDGTVLSDLTVNGTCYETKQQYTKEFFEGKLSPVTITHHMPDGQTYEEEHPYMEFSNCMPFDDDGTYLLVIYDIPYDVIEKRKMQANIEFLAMMTDVNLE